jgi:hypothetical protein
VLGNGCSLNNKGNLAKLRPGLSNDSGESGTAYFVLVAVMGAQAWDFIRDKLAGVV